MVNFYETDERGGHLQLQCVTGMCMKPVPMRGLRLGVGSHLVVRACNADTHSHDLCSRNENKGFGIRLPRIIIKSLFQISNEPHSLISLHVYKSCLN